MQTLFETPQTEVEKVYDYLPADEGSIELVYGKIGSGKTYCLTSRILEDLRRGQVVYANWQVNFEGYDERLDWFSILFGLLGFKYEYLKVNSPNFHFVDMRDFKGAEFTNWLSGLTDCVVYLDEGQTVLNSYEKTEISRSKQSAIAFTRHFNRRIVVASQRWQNIHVQARANVNYFTKCERLFKFGRIVRFRLSTFEDMDTMSGVLEEEPSEVRSFWGRKAVFNAFSSKYLRGITPISQPNYASLWYLTMKEKWQSLTEKIRGRGVSDTLGEKII